MICAIVKRLVSGDFLLEGLSSVEPVDGRTREQVRTYLASYGETLIELPDATWESSVAQWMEGHWEVLIDLWTKEFGMSDLCLFVRVFEDSGGLFRIEVDSVNVP